MQLIVWQHVFFSYSGSFFKLKLPYNYYYFPMRHKKSLWVYVVPQGKNILLPVYAGPAAPIFHWPPVQFTDAKIFTF
jgi:hypothetical protein